MRLLQRVRHEGNTLEELLRRPDVDWDQVASCSSELAGLPLSARAKEQATIEIKYAGYVRRQEAEIERQQKVQSVRIPETFDFQAIPQLRIEAREKFTRVQPRDLGQAGRISGITPADLAVLMLYLKEPNRLVS